MKINFQITHLLVFVALTVQWLEASAVAQQVVFPDPNLDAAVRATLQKPIGPLTQQDLLGLTNLSAISRSITNLQGLGAARNLTALFLDDNHLTDASFPGELTNLTSLTVLDLSENELHDFALPNTFTNLTKLRIELSHLTQIALPPGLTRLSELSLSLNQLTNLVLPVDMTNLNVLSAYNNQLTNLTFPPNLSSLTNLTVDGNQLTQLALPAGLSQLSVLIAGANRLSSFTVPIEMTNLTFLRLNDNQLTNLTLPSPLEQLSLLYLPGNQLRQITLPGGLTNLDTLVLAFNQLTNVTVPPEVTRLTTFLVENNPLSAFVLSEPLATNGLAAVIDSLKNQGVGVFTYPVNPQLVRPLPLVGAFKFSITGPPGIYSVFDSTNLTTWKVLSTVTNPLGSINFVDVSAQSSVKKFYRTLLQGPPTNMVFIPPNTFRMGSPTNEQDRSTFTEGPQATVTLTRGFWIGKYEVTQGEYLAITGENPTDFPGDLNRAISSVTWFDATNYCWKLTRRELAAGRIPPGSRYRLPTEAEWECAARAGTTTRFSYGDDPFYLSTTNYAWFLDLGHPDLIVHPVGQKIPNYWGLYDMAGNVWEWCEDWYGDQVGGILIDPTGPPGPVQFGRKVMRGGAYDYPNSDCRSASRLFRPDIQPDSDLGFRVVLASD